jgi:GNAT superfamily N-acetyltransferase
MDYRVRIARPEDLPVLLEFEQGVIRAERPMDPMIREGEISYYEVGEFIRSGDAEVYVVECEGQIVASGCVRIKPDRHYLKHKRMGYLGFMFVSEEYRGKGLNEVRLDVYQTNASAIRAYEKAGFERHLITMRLNTDDL